MRRVILLVAVIVLFSLPLAAEPRAVFIVEASKCVHEPKSRAQTGFAVEGRPGIFTALHGVVDCDYISARHSTGEFESQPDLKVELVDVSRDVAVVGTASFPVGFRPGRRLEPGDQISVLGHPAAMAGLHRMKLKLEDPLYCPLGDLLPRGSYEVLRVRASPSVGVEVLSIHGDLQAGHSGAPILNSDGAVVGVGIGGLRGGAVGIAWAAPFENLNMVAPVKSVLERLKSQRASLLFTMGVDDEINWLVKFRLEDSPFPRKVQAPSFGPGQGRRAPPGGLSLPQFEAESLRVILKDDSGEESAACSASRAEECNLRLPTGEYSVYLEGARFRVGDHEVVCDLTEAVGKGEQIRITLERDMLAIVSARVSWNRQQYLYDVCEEPYLGGSLRVTPLI